MKKLKRLISIISITSITTLTAAMLTSCSLPWAKNSAPTTAATEAPSSEITQSLEDAIIGKWSISSISDADGNEVSVSDIDMSSTPLDGMSSIIGMVIKKGAVIEFKSDGTVSLSALSGSYEVSDSTSELTLNISQISKEINLPIEISGENMVLKIKSYSIDLTKK